MSAVTYAELCFGVERHPDQWDRTGLRPWGLVEDIPVLPFDEGAASYGFSGRRCGIVEGMPWTG